MMNPMSQRCSVKLNTLGTCTRDSNRQPPLQRSISSHPTGALLNDILAGKEQVNFQHGTQLVQKLLGASLEEFRAAQHAVILNDGPGLHLVGR